MNSQKDNQKTDLNLQGQNSSVLINNLINKDINNYISKKTEKLVTALYMVSDCMDQDDAIKSKLRSLGVSILSDTFKLSIVSSLDRNHFLGQILSNISETSSLIEISCNIGFISEMNTNILKREFERLAKDLESQLIKDNNFSFSLNKDMFVVESLLDEKMIENKSPFVKDISYNGQNKRTENIMSFTNNDRNMSFTRKQIDRKPVVHDKENKNERYQKIIDLIKSKKDSILFGAEGISIKDISNEFAEYSEKTIQRDLNDLINKGQIVKSGQKRWSRYKLATS